MPLSRAWLVVLLLWPVALLNYLDRMMLATVKPFVVADLSGFPAGRENEYFGYLLAVFMWVYAVLSPVGGLVGDRLDRRRLVVFSLLVWSAVTWATGLARTFDQMLALRALMGVSEAFYIPAALALIADFHPGETRTRAVGVHQTGIYAGVFLGGLTGYVATGAVVPGGTWRHPFLGCGAFGVLYAAVLYFTLPGSPAGTAPDRPKAGPGAALAALWGVPAFWLLVLYFTLPAGAGWAMKNWLPAHLSDKPFELDAGTAGLFALSGQTAGNVFGAVAGGWLADWWAARSERGRVYASALGTALCVPALLGIALAPSLPAEVAAAGVVAAVVLFGVGWGMFDANNMPILCQIVRPEFRATGYGFMNLVSISAGAGVTVLLGRMRDANTPFAVAFAAFAGVALVSVGLILLIRPARAAAER